ncbi:MAG: dihydropteroate synthase [Actinomycetota bacterium]|nr:dihydropteroate synthase [Actinomycetota bacterium]MDA8396788.1 dihydropteroate synthase [Actinomycetota bacterium]
MSALVMGVVNVTPDSFSDGGDFFDHAKAIEHGLELVGLGCDIVDVGGESTRPGSLPIDEEEEVRRVLPVVAALSKQVRVSIDTVKPSVARAAIDAGATLVNDISSSLAEVAAAAGVGWVAMHMQGEPRTMQENPHYDDVVSEVVDYLRAKADWARQLGINEIWLDPGIGFGKTVEHNLELLANIDPLVELGFPVLVGTSRKTFLGRIASRFEGEMPPPRDRLEGSLATAAWCFSRGVRAMRVHDVREVLQLRSLAGYR